MITLIYPLLLFFFLIPSDAQQDAAVKFMKSYNDTFTPLYSESAEAAFRKATNITDINSKIQDMASEKVREKLKTLREQAKEVNLTGADDGVKRQFKLLLTTASSSNVSVANRASAVGTKMENIYGTATIPNDPTIIKTISVNSDVKELNVNSHLEEIMSKSNDTAELLYVWKAWRDATGPKLRPLYEEYVAMNNIGAKENGYHDAGEYKRKIYEVDNLDTMADDFLKDLRMIYLELHGYVRYRLSKIYPKLVKPEGLIPAHLLGNMWAQNWDNIYDKMIPYPDEPTIDVTPKLKENYTVNTMFKMAESFFMSLGWPKLPDKFWTHSLFVQPKDRKVECHASAWDFSATDNGQPDVRIKMCTKVNHGDFITIHHELGHIYYDLLYWNQPLEYRGGANPGFHEAVGDTIVLSVNTPGHLNAVGLLDSVSSSKEADINFLMKTALERIAFLPFGYLMDKWMWNVYSGEIKPDEYNQQWWHLRRKYQGIKPPTNRTENDFDPGAKYHIPGDTPYIRYFFSYILQFAFHKKACNLSGNTKPLHQCSIYKSKEAGKAFGDMLSLGRSKPWPEALKQFTGSEKISTDAIKEYFQPLMVWMREYRKKEAYQLGWSFETKLQSNSIVHGISKYVMFLSIGLTLLLHIFV